MVADRAPITNLMLTVQFAPPAVELNPVALAELYADFRSDFPIFEQVTRAGPMPIGPTAVIEIEPPFGPPRNSFLSADKSLNLLFQNDRFSYGWTRHSPISEPANYPGFECMMGNAEAYWMRLLSKLEGRVPPLEALVGEVMYLDAFSLRDGAQLRRLSSIFNFLNPDHPTHLAGFTYVWHEPVASGGFTQIQISGPGQNSHGELIAQLQTITRFQIHGSWGGIRGPFDSAHKAISDTFVRLINPAARPI